MINMDLKDIIAVIKLQFDATRYLLDSREERVAQLFFDDTSPYKVLVTEEFSIGNLQTFSNALTEVIYDSSQKKTLRVVLANNFYNLIQNILLKYEMDDLKNKVEELPLFSAHDSGDNLAEVILKCGYEAFENYQIDDRFPDMKYGMRFGVFPPSREYLECLHEAYVELQLDNSLSGEIEE